jgi:hypothetical protein
MKSLSMLAIALVASLCLGFFVRYERVHAQGTRLPRTLTRITRMLDANAVPREVDTEILATRSDGSLGRRSIKVTSLGVPDSKVVETREIVDAVARKRTSLEVLSNSKSTFPMNDTEVKKFTGAPDKSCATFADAKMKVVVTPVPEPSSLLGYSVIKVTLSVTETSDRSMSVERWLSPELDCEALREVATMILKRDGSKYVTTKEVVSLLIGEPEQGLFEIPTDAVERSPSEVLAAVAQSRGEVCKMCDSKLSTMADKNYFARHSAVSK